MLFYVKIPDPVLEACRGFKILWKIADMCLSNRDSKGLVSYTMSQEELSISAQTPARNGNKTLRENPEREPRNVSFPK